MREPATRTPSAPGENKRTVSVGKPPVVLLLLLTLAGAVWRVAAFFFNVWPHGDVVLDAAIAENVANRGALLVPFVDVRYYPIDRFGFGYPLDQHPPLWTLLGVPFVRLAGDGYTALKLVSLLIGIAVIPLAYFMCRPLIGPGPALMTAVLVAGSYPLVDFSGNGSLWILLAAFYLLFVWRVGGWGLEDRRNAALVGLIMGLAYLANYPALVLPITLVLLHQFRHGRASLGREALAGPAVALGVMLLVISPWLVHNLVLFGNPFWSQPFERTLAGGSRQVEYLIVGDEVIKRNLPSSGGMVEAFRARAVDLYGNVGFVARQMLVLTPVLCGLFIAGVGWWALGAGGRRTTDEGRTTDEMELIGPSSSVLRPSSVLVLLALVHLALVLYWPTTKFRYLVPLMPLVLAIGSWFLWELKPFAQRSLLVVVTAGLCVFTNLWTFVSIPSHTYYYDGGLIDDNFGGQGETAWVEETRSFRAAADAIVARGPGAILGYHLMHPFTHQPLVMNSTGYPRDVVAHLVDKYDIRYVVSDHAHAGAYDFLTPTQIWSDERFVVLEVRGRSMEHVRFAGMERHRDHPR
jgi:4-amino-4-deoxy-L-arabinose transferase-like glycosyltransferase